MRADDFGELKPLVTWLAIAAAGIFCGVGTFFIKVDVFAKLNPDYPLAKRMKHFHKKFGITFIVFALVWLVIFLAAIYQ